jgi:hypothetical protein
MRNAYRILFGEPEGKTPLGRPRHKWRIILKWIFMGYGLRSMDWIYLAQDTDQ